MEQTNRFLCVLNSSSSSSVLIYLCERILGEIYIKLIAFNLKQFVLYSYIYILWWCCVHVVLQHYQQSVGLGCGFLFGGLIDFGWLLLMLVMSEMFYLWDWASLWMSSSLGLREPQETSDWNCLIARSFATITKISRKNNNWNLIVERSEQNCWNLSQLLFKSSNIWMTWAPERR